MNNSLKIGIIAGIVAGFIAGVVAIIFQNIGFTFGLSYAMMWSPPSNFALVHILMGLIWGVIFGIIYSIGYRLIPGKGVSKSLLFGMLIFLITNFREAVWYLPYSPAYNTQLFPWMFIGIFMWIAYGLVLGFLYESLHQEYGIFKEEKKIVTYDMISGLHAGALAGFIGGVAAFLSRILGGLIGLFEMTISFFKEGQWIAITPTPFNLIAAVHIFFNMIWGIVFGLLYPLVYNLIPGKGVIKGICYGMIILLVTSFRLGIYYLAWGEIIDLFWIWTYIGFFNTLFFGLVIGYAYKKE